MTKTMAEVLAEHYLQFKWDRNSGVTFWFCRSCEFATEDFEQAAAHQAAALSASGYGLVADFRESNLKAVAEEIANPLRSDPEP